MGRAEPIVPHDGHHSPDKFLHLSIVRSLSHYAPKSGCIRDLSYIIIYKEKDRALCVIMHCVYILAGKCIALLASGSEELQSYWQNRSCVSVLVAHLLCVAHHIDRRVSLAVPEQDAAFYELSSMAEACFPLFSNLRLETLQLYPSPVVAL